VKELTFIDHELAAFAGKVSATRLSAVVRRATG
jgi:hypothetical protein